MRGVDPLLIDLAARECINVECRCGRVVQLAPYQLLGRNGITAATKAWSLRERFPVSEVQAPAAQASVD